MFLDTITRPNKVESVIKTLNFLEKENVSLIKLFMICINLKR